MRAAFTLLCERWSPLRLPVRPHSARREGEAGYGYVIGLHEKLMGKAARVWVIDEEQLEMDMLEPLEPE